MVNTNISTSKLYATRHIHTHDPKPDSYFVKLHARQGIKRRASDHPGQKPLKMICLEIEENTDLMNSKDLTNFQKSVNRSKLERRGGGKTLPQNTDEVLAILEEQIISKSEKGAALIKEVDRQSQVVMLATDKSLQLLNDHNQQGWNI